jgi:AraC family transcriptional regulator, positive regulator of tynA and feaB
MGSFQSSRFGVAVGPGHGNFVDLSTNKVKPRERVQFWREMVCRTFVNLEMSSDLGASFSGQLISRPWANLQLSHVRANAHTVERSRQHPSSAQEDSYFAAVLLSGTYLLEQDGRQVVLRPGDLTIYDASRPHRLLFTQDFSKLILSIPRPTLRDRIPGIERCTALRISGDDGIGAIASGFLRSLVGNADQLNAETLANLSDQAIDLLGMAVASVRPVEALLSRSGGLSLCRVKAFIEQHVADPDLDTKRIAYAVGLSPRYTNKLFEDDGTSLMRYVWKRRLEHCHRDLLDAGKAGQHISEIALRWGFNDLSHFSRVFRQRFGSG